MSADSLQIVRFSVPFDDFLNAQQRYIVAPFDMRLWRLRVGWNVALTGSNIITVNAGAGAVAGLTLTATGAAAALVAVATQADTDRRHIVRAGFPVFVNNDGGASVGVSYGVCLLEAIRGSA